MTSTQKPSVLIVDDEKEPVTIFLDFLGEDYECFVSNTSTDAMKRIEERSWDLIFLDQHLGHGMSGLDILDKLREAKLDTPVIMISQFAKASLVRDAWKRGATDFIGKMPSRAELLSAVEHSLRTVKRDRASLMLKKEVRSLSAVGPSDEQWLLTGSTVAVKRVNDEVRRIAKSELKVLILGESGTGKDRVARAIHELSDRKDGPFVAYNCATANPQLVESELRGHVKNAFNNAEHKKGLFEDANSGTMFLDEIGCLPASLQAVLLRLIEEKKFRRLGGNTEIYSDFRLLCATNSNLEEMIRKGEFREDLYQRLHVATIVTPPLRDRKPDIPELASNITRQLCKNTTAPVLSNEVLTVLQENSWSGNVRQLRNALEYACSVCKDGQIEVGDLPAWVSLTARPSPYREAKEEWLTRFDRDYWSSLLDRCGGNKTEMERVSGISRQMIYKILRKLNLESGREGEHEETE
ncbi:MAG: sigma-54-dependent Fis family transcriptional regulator [Calditrichaeota bacterium]|nr:sigma-54-dependent Fis family transcriptional regulator [Calditrichota bacterium]MCB9367176.1 sigma-54-dependent Fis family transcriptional regulator [Calditrichota bacterium]